MSEQKLPMAGEAPPAAPVQVSTSSARMIATLAGFGAVAGAAIVLGFTWTQPRILQHQAERLANAVTEVLGGAETYKTAYLENNAFTFEPQADTAGLDRVYVGYTADGQPRGVAISTEASGFADVVRVIFGFDPASGNLLGMKVLEQKETPGLGDKVEKDTLFTRQFIELGTPIVGVKLGRQTGAEEEVVMITGVTISSRTVIDMINRRLEAVGEPVKAFWSAGGASEQPGGVK
ncbi:MAG: FMN-binding protein [Gemmatimonadetes bacterium]|nr:FMN-binding protein [Gemmatimonadota bacterium]